MKWVYYHFSYTTTNTYPSNIGAALYVDGEWAAYEYHGLGSVNGVATWAVGHIDQITLTYHDIWSNYVSIDGSDEPSWGAMLVDDSYEPPGPPVAVTHSLIVNYNTGRAINLLAGDYDPGGTPLSLTGVTQPKHGTIQLNGNGTVTYTPFNGYLGTDAFTYTITDGLGMSAKATVSISVKWAPIVIDLGTLGNIDEPAITLPAAASGEMVVYKFTTDHPMYLDGALDRTSIDSLSAFLTTGELKASLTNSAPTLGAGHGGYVDIGVGQEVGSTTDLYQDPIMPGSYTFEIDKSPTAHDVTVQLHWTANGDEAGNNRTWADNLGVLKHDGSVVPFTGYVNPIDDKDVFKFTLDTASSVMIALQTQDMDGPTLTGPVPFRLWDGSNLVVYTGTAASNPLPKGTYYVEVDNGRSLDPANENYNLFVASWADKAGNTPVSALALGNLTGKASQQSDYVGLADRNDYYSFTLNAKTKFDIALTSTSGLDVDWELMSVGTAVNQTVNITELDTGSGVPDAAPVLNAGTYWIRVYSADTYVFPSAWGDPLDLPDSPGPNYTLNLAGQKIATPTGPAPIVTHVGWTPGKGSEVDNGSTVTITLAFSTNVSVSGTPALTLNDDGRAVYSSGSGTNALIFIYTVGASDHSTALGMTGAVTGGLITDASGQPANIAATAFGVQINIDQWKTAASGDWLSGPWSRGATPSSSDLVLLTTAGTYTVTSGQDETIAGLTVAGSTTLSLGGGTFTVTGAAANAGRIMVNAGTLHIEGAATGAGAAVIAGAAEAELSGTGSTMRVSFAAAATGTLRLDASQSFTGTIGGFAPGQSIDLADISYVNGHTTFSYAPNSLNSGGMLTVTDHIGHAAHLQIAGIYGLTNFQINSDGHGGTLFTEQKRIAPSASNAPTSIPAGDVLVIGTAYKGAVTFSGANETLWLGLPSSFTGTVSGFGAQDAIDLPGIIYNSNSATPSYTPNASSTGGTLSVSDGLHTANIALLGNYTAGNFATASDGHGGTLIVDPPAPPTLSVTSDPSAIRGQTLSLSSLVTISDPSNIGYQKLELWDSNGTPTGGQFVVNGIAQSGNIEIDVSPANFANTVFDVGTLGGTDKLTAALLQDNGTLTTKQQFTVTAPQGAVVQPGATVSIPANFSGAIDFLGSTGTVDLTSPSSFSGTIAGMTGEDTIDLAGFNFKYGLGAGIVVRPPPSVTTSFSGTSAGGTLTVNDSVGPLTANIALLGNYLASTFTASSDGSGGTNIVDHVNSAASQQTMLAVSHS